MEMHREESSKMMMYREFNVVIGMRVSKVLVGFWEDTQMEFYNMLYKNVDGLRPLEVQKFENER